MKKIVLFTPGIPPENYSGEGAYSLKLANELSKKYSIIILTISKKKRENVLERRENYEIQYIHSNRNKIFKIFTLVRLASYIIKNKKEIFAIQHQGINTYSYFLILVSNLFGIKNICRMVLDGQDDAQTIKKNPFFFSILKRVDYFISLSPELTKKFNFSGLKKSLVEVPQATNIVKPDFERKRKIGLPRNILSIGAISERKNTLFIIKVFKELVNKKPDLKSRIVGSKSPNFGEYDESYITKITEYINKNNLEEKIEFIEFTNNVIQEYMWADIFLFPSRKEGCPNVIVEAIVTELPIICSELDGTSNFLLKRKKTICEKEEVEEYIEKITKFFNVDEYTSEIKYLRSIKSEYFFEKNIIYYKKIYDDLNLEKSTKIKFKQENNKN